MATMRAFQVSKKGGALELVERPVPQPTAGFVRIKVQACGICHSDVLTKEGAWPGIAFPRVPGHEVIGVIDALGPDVPPRWQVGQRVGVGWHSSHCGHCDMCRRGEFFACLQGPGVTGVTLDGGYAEYMVAPVTALALVPSRFARHRSRAADVRGADDLQRAAQQRRHSGDVVAILGIGGLGHLGVQYAAKMGYRTVAIARGQDKEPLAPAAGRDALHRQPDVRPGRRIAKARRRESHHRHGDARPRDARDDRRPRAVRQADGDRRGGVAGGLADLSARWPALDHRLVLGHVDRLGRYAGVQRPQRRATDERNLSARKSSGSLRADAEREGTVPRGADHGLIVGLMLGGARIPHLPSAKRRPNQ